MIERNDFCSRVSAINIIYFSVKMIPVFPLVAAAFALLLFLEEPQNALFVGCELHEYLTSVNLVILAKTV